MAALIIRRFGTNEEVSRIELRHTHKRYVDRVMHGAMLNMNLDEFYIDDSEVEDSPVVGVDIPHPGHPADYT